MGLKQRLACTIAVAAITGLAGCVDGDEGMAAVAPEAPVVASVQRDLDPQQQALRDTPTAEAAGIVAAAYRSFGCTVAPDQRGAFNAVLRETTVATLGIAPAEVVRLSVDLNSLEGRGEVALVDDGRLVLEADGTRRFDCAA
jgi:hypothetical protein